MFERLTTGGRRGALAIAAAAAFGGLFAGCSGDGAGAGGSLVAATPPSSGTGGASSAASIQLLKSAPSLASVDGSSLTLTAIVKSAGNVGLKDQTVAFSTTDSGVRLDVSGDKTDASGASVAKLTLSDPTNREVPISITSGSATTVEKIAVVGTTISLAAPTSVAFGQSAEFSVTLRDSASNPIVGKAVTVSSRAGNTVTTSGTTNMQGQLKITVGGAVAGSDTLTVSAMGATDAKVFNVSGDQLSYQDVLSEVLVNSNAVLKVRLVRNGAVQAGQPISLTATRGTLSSASPITDASGVATATISSATAGLTSVIATGPGGLQATARMEFVSDTPAKVTLQSSPSVVGANVASTSTNSSQLIAVVRDAADNPVKNKRVNFSFVTDPSNGSIDPGSAITDSTGLASVAFIAGPTPTGNNAVRVRASVEGTSLTSDTTLTVSRRELFVRIGTGNEVEKLDTTKNAMPYTAIVSDASGNPVKDVVVQASLLPETYFKGFYAWDELATAWVKQTNIACQSEDTNTNGQLDPGEDTAPGIGNGNGILTPGNPAVVTFTSASGNKTGADGTVDMKITYPRDHATWLRVRLRVTATVVAGTEGLQDVRLTLPGIASDYTAKTVAPPGASSPYGVGACTVPN
jgi:hypothetical protein